MDEPAKLLKRYLDRHESEIFGWMTVWAQNALPPQIRAVSKPGCEDALFLLTHAFIQTFMDAAFDLHGSKATEAFLKRFVDGRKKHEKFSLIAGQLHKMRNVMAHQLYSSLTHDIVLDHKLKVGWQRDGGRLHISPGIYAERFLATLQGARLGRWRRWTTRVQLTRHKYRFICKWLDLPSTDPMRLEVKKLVALPNLTTMRPAERKLRRLFRMRYGV